MCYRVNRGYFDAVECTIELILNLRKYEIQSFYFSGCVLNISDGLLNIFFDIQRIFLSSRLPIGSGRSSLTNIYTNEMALLLGNLHRSLNLESIQFFLMDGLVYIGKLNRRLIHLVWLSFIRIRIEKYHIFPKDSPFEDVRCNIEGGLLIFLRFSSRISCDSGDKLWNILSLAALTMISCLN